MERRSRSQVRRVENAALAGGGGGSLGGQTAHSRHASTTRVAEPMMLNGGVEQGARTLSPDRKDRYRASGRGGGYGYDMPPTAGVPPHHMVPAATGSNANSYNQYNSNSQSYGAGGYASSPPSSLLPQHSPAKAPAVTADNGGSLQVSSAVQVHHYSFSASPPLLIFLLLLTGDFPRLDATDAGRVLG
jgi:hypothetical protein